MTGPSLWGAVRRGVFPHQLSWFLDNPLRRLMITPAALADRLRLNSTSRVLEVGPGSGYFSLELARRVPEGRLQLLDLQPEMLAQAAQKFGGQLPGHVQSIAADACGPLPFDDASFDVVVLVTVLGELPCPKDGLASFYRVLRPGGIIAVHEQLPDPDIIWPARLGHLMTGAGFRPLGRQGPKWNYTALFEKPVSRGAEQSR